MVIAMMTQMITCEHDIYSAISKVKYLMRDLPFTEIDVQSVLVSLMEITRNVLIHGGGRGQLICHKVTQGICLIVKDQGPGIENLDEILKGSKPSSQDQIYRVTIEKKFEDAEVSITGKRNQLKKAFFNILKNAFEAIEGQGTIKIHHYIQDELVYVTISDTGAGIPKERIDLLGTPFYTTKSEGTGMGLAYVFSTIYQHNGRIEIESEEGKGTTFKFSFPMEMSMDKGVERMDLHYESDIDLQGFFDLNKQEFERCLLQEVVNLQEILDEIKTVGSIDLLANAHHLAALVIDNRELEVINFAQLEGKFWAQHSTLNIAVKLEWFQAIRRVLWHFIYNFTRLSGSDYKMDDFFKMEHRINITLDIFLRHFFTSYTTFKDEMIKTHREMIDDLSVPLIPLTSSVFILPLLGTIDTRRAKAIQEKVLHQIETHKIRSLIIDMSGVVYLDTMVVQHLFKILDGISYMGCTAIITGIRAEIANTMVNLGISLNDRIETKGTLQQALEELGLQITNT